MNSDLDLHLLLTDSQFDFYKKLLSNPQLVTKLSNDSDIGNQIARDIFKNPYPILQLLYESKWVCFGKAIAAGLRLLIESEDEDKLLNFLCNFHIDYQNVTLVKNYALSRLELEGSAIHICLSLFARYDPGLLNDLLQQHHKKKKFSKENIWLEAVANHEHIVTTVLRKFLIENIQETFNRNNFVILRIVNELNEPNKSILDVANISELLEMAVEDDTLEPLQRMFHQDFRRISFTIDVLRKHSSEHIPIEVLTNTDGILQAMSKNLLQIGYEEMCKIVVSNHKYRLGIHSNRELKNNEFITLTYFFILSSTYELFLNRKCDSTFVNKRISAINAMLRQIRDITILCNLISDIFKLIFIRWEHLQSNRVCDKIATEDSSSEADFRIGSDPALSKRHGFICKTTTLKATLLFLKSFVSKKAHSDELRQSPNEIQEKFSKIVEAINDGLWKFSVLEKIVVTTQGPLVYDCDEILKVLQVHSDGREKSSSDDESRDRSNFARRSKRKAKAKKRMSLSHAHSGSDKEDEDKADTKENQSFISKMLASPESLAGMALVVENFKDVNKIIQNFNLKDSDLEKELHFSENQQNIRRKLISIFEKYQQEELKSKSKSLSTVEEIRNIAAKGFEASKIISIVENFASTNVINQRGEDEHLFSKFANTYSYLHHYDKDNLKAVAVMDLVTNLPFSSDIFETVLSLVEKRSDISSSSKIGNSGCFALLKNINECLRILKCGVGDLLSDNFYTLKATKLKDELAREKAFSTIFYKPNSEIGYVDDLRTYSKLFDDLKSKINYYQRFTSYMTNLAKLIQLRDPNLEFHVSELLKFDARKVIGELIFEDNLTPFEIESNVTSLNLNLVHVIALNICPEIAASNRFPSHNSTKEKNEAIFNYISNQNLLLGFLIQEITESPVDLQFSSINRSYLTRIASLSEMQHMKAIFGNPFISALLCDDFKIDMISDLNNWQKYAILDVFSENQKHLQKDKTDCILALIDENVDFINLIENIDDLTMRASNIIRNYTKIKDFNLVEDLIKSVLHDVRRSHVSIELLNELHRILDDIKVFATISELLNHDFWRETYNRSLNTPSLILENLLYLNEFEIALKWSTVANITESHKSTRLLFYSIFVKVLLAVRDQEGVDLKIFEIIEKFPEDEVVNLYEENKDKLKSLALLQHVIEYLESHTVDANYNNYKVSLKIFEHLSEEDCEQSWCIFAKPLLIIEQLIMNSKFKVLGKVLDAIGPMIDKTLHACKYCYDKLGNIYDIHSRSSKHHVFGNESSSTFILLNYNLYHKDHVITQECIDLQFRIYATKALDYQISDFYSSSEKVSQNTEAGSIDSLHVQFTMPKVPPTKDEWVGDDETLHCMCCKCAVFTMLIRRHHCRRCGRVVCFACSTHRMKIPKLYEDVPVRICDDCFVQSDELGNRSPSSKGSSADREAERRRDGADYKWQLSGNLTHDKLLREEFCYEHAPSVQLCLSILSYHFNNAQCVSLLLYHCKQLEKLLIPSPEVDYVLVTKMLNCLALAAKVRGGPTECDTVRDFSDIVKSVVLNGCENLLPTEPLNKKSLRKLADSLINAEKWSLALEVCLKCGFSTAGVMAAHGLACLRTGCFETAREKFSHCMPKISSEGENSLILKCVISEREIDMNKEMNIPIVKRPSRSPPLLEEITKLIESTSLCVPQPETLARADLIRNSNTSLASIRSRRKENIPLHEPAINILNTLSNLKQIAKGNYGESAPIVTVDNKRHLVRHSRMFEECLYYILTYGSHADVINFFMRHKQYSSALRYFILENIDSEIFIHNIFMIFLRTGEVQSLISEMLEIDDRLLIWKDTLISTCWFLESKNLLNSLYQLQILLKDPVRASMTCVRFYSMNCSTFKELQNNSFHLVNAQAHLQSELELCQWENIHVEKRRPQVQSSFLMQMDAKTLNAHINTILKQLEVTKFLSTCEQTNVVNGKKVTDVVLKQIRVEGSGLPTLFDSIQEKIQICILILLSGANVEEGYGLAYRILHDYKLPIMKVYGATSKFLALNNRLQEVDKLMGCISSNNGVGSSDIDEILTIAVNSATNITDTAIKTTLDTLIKKICSVEMRISCHIYIGQLKSAYLLAVQFNRLTDVRKILRHAEGTNQIHIKKLCEKKLNIAK